MILRLYKQVLYDYLTIGYAIDDPTWVLVFQSIGPYELNLMDDWVSLEYSASNYLGILHPWLTIRGLTSILGLSPCRAQGHSYCKVNNNLNCTMIAIELMPNKAWCLRLLKLLFHIQTVNIGTLTLISYLGPLDKLAVEMLSHWMNELGFTWRMIALISDPVSFKLDLENHLLHPLTNSVSLKILLDGASMNSGMLTAPRWAARDESEAYDYLNRYLDLGVFHSKYNESLIEIRSCPEIDGLLQSKGYFKVEPECLATSGPGLKILGWGKVVSFGARHWVGKMRSRSYCHLLAHGTDLVNFPLTLMIEPIKDSQRRWQIAQLKTDVLDLISLLIGKRPIWNGLSLEGDEEVLAKASFLKNLIVITIKGRIKSSKVELPKPVSFEDLNVTTAKNQLVIAPKCAFIKDVYSMPEGKERITFRRYKWK